MGTSEQLLAARYQLLEEVGRDDLTEAFHGVDVLDERRPVTVKVLRDVYRDYPEIAGHFIEAARAAEALRGPHVIDVYGSGEDRGLYYVVMEWVEGTSLRRMLDEYTANGRPAPLAAPEAARIAAQIASALEDAHGLGVVHAGLEPGRVLINSAGRVQVADFGFGRVLAPAAPGEAPPAPAADAGPYLAPEQVRGQEPDVRSDLFSLGALLLEMVAGPQALDALAAWRLGRTPGASAVLPRTYVPGIPAMLESIILRALRYNPGERYGSAAEFRDDLEAFLESYARRTAGYQPAAAVPAPVAAGAPAVPARRARARPRRAMGLPNIYWPWLAAALLALIVVGVLLFATANLLRVDVPRVVGLPVEEAQRSLQYAGFLAAVTYVEMPDQAPGTVLSQEPPAGTQAIRGSTVQLTAVEPPPTSAPLIEVPGVIGQTRDDARRLLEAAGLQLGAVSARSDPAVATGLVIEQNPPAQGMVPPGSAVDIVVSEGAATAVPTAVPTAPPTAVTICQGDERVAFNPPAPALNQPVLIDAYSARAHAGVAITGPGSPVFIALRQEGSVYHWQWQAVPAAPGRYEYLFSVQNGVVCTSATFEILAPGSPTSTPAPGTTPVPPASPIPAGSGVFLLTWGSFGAGNGQFSGPTGIAVYGSIVYVVDAGNDRIQKFDVNGTYLGSFGHSGYGAGEFNHPEDIAVRPDGTLVVADTNNHRIQILDAAGNALGILGRQGIEPGQFLRPHGVAVDAQGQFYVADTNNHRVQTFDSTGRFLVEFGSLGPGPGQFNFPVDLVVGASGSIYVVDSDNYRIQQFTNAGTYLRSWGGFGADPGRFNAPLAIAIDALDNLCVVDTANQRVQKFDSAGQFLVAWGTAGSASGQFANPHGVAVGSDGSVYVVDTGNNRVQKFR